MQLKKISIRNKLALATSTLLLGTPIQVNANLTHEDSPSNLTDDEFSISGLYYSEDGRVEVNKIHSKISKQINEDHRVSIDIIYDTITGATPNGRIVPENTVSEVSTITSASGRTSEFNSNSAAAKKSWLTELEDTRRAFNLEWEYRATQMLTTTWGIGTSTEDDYESYSGSGNVAWEFNQRRSSLNFGAAFSNDTVKGIKTLGSRIPDGLTPVVCIEPTSLPAWLNAADCPTALNPPTFFKPANKKVADFIIGGTQVWNRRTILQFNYARGIENGYLTDPYKQISIVDIKPEGLIESSIFYEKRPRSRNTNSLFFKSVFLPIDNVAMHTSYRYYWDDWDVSAHTVDSRLRINLGNSFYVQGHGRLHRQSAASFFDKQITVGSERYEEKPDYISADSRLGKLISATAGVKVGYKMNERIGFSARVEHMQQHYYNNTLPRLKVWIAQLILNVKF